ncbi:HAD family hydrolase [Paenibacillus qinlingensis]|uniref:Hydroxymethylpyrimidine pyrophosphatase-like HAD family hydrolase n=1 Tax=Paenibacillus qinlingensis TaxID=1837343 RepID=A0ABU1P1N4_9BACL|nr:HAD family hydrolase [Paenibacillus qinlingensis]MDR6553444.1 hydroxymethylpyrimidine pyrophosphatase-like HAD family hydrolase [Paenibacillus qinlingensis]
MVGYKLIALDLDGTTLNEEGVLSDENIHWIQKADEAGVIVIIATGRGRQTAQPHLDRLKLQHPFIVMNGSEVWRQPGELLDRQFVPRTCMNQCIDLARQYGVMYFGYELSRGLCCNFEPSSEEDNEMWMKFLFHSDELAKLDEIRGIMTDWSEVEVSSSSVKNIEITPKGISKALRLKEVCALLQISMDEVIAVGDGPNDIYMLQAAGLGIAVGNAMEEVKLAADITLPYTNGDHAVAKVIQQYVFQK